MIGSPSLAAGSRVREAAARLSLALVVFGLGVTSVALAPQGSDVAAWWPAAGVAVGAVALSADDRRWRVLAAVAAGSFLANLLGGRSLVLAGCFTAGNTLEAAVAGFWLGRAGRPALVTLRDGCRLLAAAAVGATLAGGIAALSVWSLQGGSLWLNWFSVLAAHSAAVLVLVPLVMRVAPSVVQIRRWETPVQWTMAMATVAVVFAPGQRLPVAFVAIPVLVWAGLRLGVRAASAQLLSVAVLATVLTAGGGGPFAQAARAGAPNTAAIMLQLFLLTCALVVLALAVTLSQREVALAALADSVAFHDAVLAASPDLIYVVDVVTGASVWASRNVAATLGYSVEQIQDLGSDLVATIVHPEDASGLRAANDSARELADGEVVQVRYRARDSAGGYAWLSRHATPFARDARGRVSQLLAVARDITDTVELEQQLLQAALHDPLTGLPNRRLLADRLDAAIKRTARSGGQVAVLFCDLDGFKQVNDTGGHAAGDAVLTVTATRLQALLRPPDTVARVGGDEFVVVLDPPQFGFVVEGDAGVPIAGLDALSAAEAVARRIAVALREPVVVAGVSHVVTVSMGLVLADAGDDPDATLRSADTALYRAKALGKDRLQIFAQPDRSQSSALPAVHPAG